MIRLSCRVDRGGICVDSWDVWGEYLFDFLVLFYLEVFYFVRNYYYYDLLNGTFLSLVVTIGKRRIMRFLIY